MGYSPDTVPPVLTVKVMDPCLTRPDSSGLQGLLRDVGSLSVFSAEIEPGIWDRTLHAVEEFLCDDGLRGWERS